jgi:hypothetical protein
MHLLRNHLRTAVALQQAPLGGSPFTKFEVLPLEQSVIVCIGAHVLKVPSIADAWDILKAVLIDTIPKASKQQQQPQLSLPTQQQSPLPEDMIMTVRMRVAFVRCVVLLSVLRPTHQLTHGSVIAEAFLAMIHTVRLGVEENGERCMTVGAFVSISRFV